MWAGMNSWFRLTKPGVVILLQITAISAVVVHDLMSETRPPLGHTLEASLITLVGGYLTAGGSNAINMWYDKDIDPMMKRTSSRPVPLGEIKSSHALLFGISISILGIVWFTLMAGQVAAFWATFSILFYVFVYTIWLKRRTVQNIVIGGLAGSTPPLIGWFVAMGPRDLDLHSMNGFLVSITDTGSLVPFYMLGVIFLWTPPHFWALALYKSDEYRQVGVPMLPWVKGSARTLAEMRLYGILLLVISLWGPYLIHSGDFSMEYLVLQIGSALIAIWYIRTLFLIPADEVKDENGRLPSAARSFWVSQLFLGLVFLMALAAVSNFAGMVVGLTLSMAVILRSEKKYRSSGFPFS